MKELFVEKMKNWINNPGYKITFWEKFYQEEVSKLMITYFKDQKVQKNNNKVKENNKNKIASVFDNKRDTKVIPFVCTNLLGDIKIDAIGIKAKFSNIVEKGGVKYRVDFSKRADVESVNFLNPKPYTPENIQETSDGKYYFCVQYKSNMKNKKRNISTKYSYYRAYPNDF